MGSIDHDFSTTSGYILRRLTPRGWLPSGNMIQGCVTFRATWRSAHPMEKSGDIYSSDKNKSWGRPSILRRNGISWLRERSIEYHRVGTALCLLVLPKVVGYEGDLHVFNPMLGQEPTSWGRVDDVHESFKLPVGGWFGRW